MRADYSIGYPTGGAALTVPEQCLVTRLHRTLVIVRAESRCPQAFRSLRVARWGLVPIEYPPSVARLA
jgi:hypothetical protein